MREAISDVFAALADETRRDIYEKLLASTRGSTATELATSARVSRQAIVKHLQVLARAGLATAKRDGREVRYFVDRNGTVAVSDWLVDRADAWDRRLATLDANAKRVPRRRNS